MATGEGPPRRCLRRAPVTRVVLVAFFAIAATVSALSAVTLLAPGGPLDVIWRPKPDEYRALLAHRAAAGLGFCALAPALAAAAVGCHRRRAWGWWLALLLVAGNLLGDCAQLVARGEPAALLPVVFAGAVLAWLCTGRVRPGTTAAGEQEPFVPD